MRSGAKWRDKQQSNKGMIMHKRNIWFKIVILIIIQALLLTQAESAIASIFQSKDLCREAALKYQKITTKTISLIFGIGYLSRDSKKARLDTLFSLLKGTASSLSEKILTRELSNINNEIYKVFALIPRGINSNQGLIGYLLDHEYAIPYIALRKTKESTGPPVMTKNLNRVFISRIV